MPACVAQQQLRDTKKAKAPHKAGLSAYAMPLNAPSAQGHY
jgi:hypothetical protein